MPKQEKLKQTRLVVEEGMQKMLKKFDLFGAPVPTFNN